MAARDGAHDAEAAADGAVEGDHDGVGALDGHGVELLRGERKGRETGRRRVVVVLVEDRVKRPLDESHTFSCVPTQPGELEEQVP